MTDLKMKHSNIANKPAKLPEYGVEDIVLAALFHEDRFVGALEVMMKTDREGAIADMVKVLTDHGAIDRVVTAKGMIRGLINLGLIEEVAARTPHDPARCQTDEPYARYVDQRVVMAIGEEAMDRKLVRYSTVRHEEDESGEIMDRRGAMLIVRDNGE